ncbi:hypothetical protein N566_00340 [Streptomycetaceae bacterium MP113-05]|nr:hypothetical protein N566_00340 [Streptomycetaceae bacterium MP113-05]
MMASGVLDDAALARFVTAAVAAPSIHNTQPWRFRLGRAPLTVEVLSASERSLRYADPRHRALHISGGAALFNLRVAMIHEGWETNVRTLPDPSRPDLLASVSAWRRDRPPSGHGELYDSVWRRHSSREPFSNLRLPASVVLALTDAAREEGAILRMPTGAVTARLLSATAEAERRNEQDPARRAESRSWVRDDGRDGIPLTALGSRDRRGALPLRDFAAAGPTGRRTAADFERRANIGVLTTRGDRPSDWVTAGQALERVLLTATDLGVRTSLFFQAIEWPGIRAALHTYDPGMGPNPQMLIRFGYGPPGPDTPRRRLRDVMSG